MEEMNENEPSTSADVTESRTGPNNRKRCAPSPNDDDQSAKRFIAEEDDDDPTFKLLDFTDEVLLEIFQNCDCTTLYALSKTCKHFLKLIEDRRLWKTFNFQTKRMMGRQIKKLLTALQIVDIKELKVRGFVSKYPAEKWKNNTMTVKTLRRLSSSCPRLETMEIREGYINFNRITLADFPPTLKCLMFYGCQIPLPRRRIFSKIDDHLQLLEEISLEKCPWFETHDLVLFSKLPHLKRLILRGCPSLKGCVPYGSIATRFGFKSLEYLDVRDTPISDSDIQCFNITSTLREILMDCPIELRDAITSTDEYSLPSDVDSADSSDSESPKENTESESEPESECSTDSEDNDDDDENGAARANANEDDANTHHQGHYIQVILQNGRMINVNAERSNDNDNPMRESNRLRCVIGIINRDSAEQPANPQRVIATPFRYQRVWQSNQADQSNEQTAKVPTDPSANPESSSSSEKPTPNESDNAGGSNTNGISQPGPSGLQTNQNDSQKASKSNSDENSVNGNGEAGPSNGSPSNQNIQIENRPYIIVQQRRQPSDDENGNNMNRRISWEVRNVFPIRESSFHNRRPYTIVGSYITDRGLCSFGMPRRSVQEGIIWIRAELRPPDTLLERITVRNYSEVTDVTLRHLAQCAPNLRYLDVTGTSVTRKGITTFLKGKPECQVVSNLLNT